MPNNYNGNIVASDTPYRYSMISTYRFIRASEEHQYPENSGVGDLLKVRLLFSVSILSLLLALLWPIALRATEKKRADKGRIKSEQTKKAEAFLANAEQMIEQMILQIDRQNGNDAGAGELADNPDPTSFVSSLPNIKPVKGSITSSFGLRLHPIYNLSLFHQGIDIAASEGTNVQTTGDGIVAFSGYDKGYGQIVAINHGYGYKTTYAHLSKLLVHQGQRVSRGDIIALSGNTGISTAPHLHYEVQKDNVKVNPTAYFFNDTTPETFISTQGSSLEKSDKHS